MDEHREKSAALRGSNDRRDDHRRLEHRRKENIVVVDTDKRKTIDQRKGYQRKS
tara:strand:+ start:464 stop:625 length:162 start_codon:yes stop_codon:yes gene_type:complete